MAAIGENRMDLWDCALGFMNSQVLLTAEEIGVFDALDGGPRTAREVGGSVGLSADSALRLLTALCALSLVEKRPDGRYANGPEASRQLVRGKPGYIGSMFHHVRKDLYPVWRHLREALEEERSQWHRAFPGSPAPTEKLFDESEGLREFMEGMHAVSYPPARDFAERAREIREVKSVVDVGGASGAFLIALAHQHPELEGTVFDLPTVRPIAEGFIHGEGLADRLSFHGGDFWEDPLPAGADAYSLGFVLHDWDTEGGSRLLGKIAEASRPGGLLILGEYLLNDEGTGPLFVARQDLNMLVAARGRERSAAEYGRWLAEHGFELEKIYPVSNGKNFLVARYGAS
jgi:hypothetical protein